MASTKDKMGRPIVVVTGLGVVTSLGAGKTDNWAKLTAGESGIRNITRFPTDGLKTRIAGTIDFLRPQPCRRPRCPRRFADLAAEEAIAESGIGAKGDFPGPLFLAVPPIEIEWPQRHRDRAPSRAPTTRSPTTICCARAARFPGLSRALPVRLGRRPPGRQIRHQGLADLAVDRLRLGRDRDPARRRGDPARRNRRRALHRHRRLDQSGSADPLFAALGAVDQQRRRRKAAARPFAKNRDGFVMAEGAGALVLESYESAKARGAKILGVLEGCGEMADAFHRTRSSPDGKPIIGCIANAIEDAGLTPDDIDYVNAHGTGTPENDKMEYLGVSTVFGERMKSVPISSNKSMIGHTLSAAGAVEAVFSLLTLQHQRIPPTINYEMPDPAIPLDVVPNKARDAQGARTPSPIPSASAGRTSRW